MSGMSASALTQLRIRHFKLIESLVSVGSLHKAARALHLSQPAASAMLKEVEEALGATLFERTRKRPFQTFHPIRAPRDSARWRCAPGRSAPA